MEVMKRQIEELQGQIATYLSQQQSDEEWPEKSRKSPFDRYPVQATPKDLVPRCKERKGFGAGTIPSSTTPSQIRVGR